MTPQELKNSILQMAIQGKLVEQRPEEGTSDELVKQLKEEKAKLVLAGKAYKKKPTKPFYDEDELTNIDIPDTWNWVQLSDVSLIQEGAGIRKWQYRDCGIQILCVTNILEDSLDLEKKKLYISEEEYKEKYLHLTLNQGDIVTSCSGGSWGKIAFFDTEKILMLNTSTLRMRFWGDLADNQYLYYVCKSSFFKRQLERQLSGMQPNFGYAHYSRIVIPLPPLAEQKRIVAKIEELLPLIDRYEAAWSRLEDFNKRFPEDMQKSLLQQAIQGKLVEQCPEEGTGEELYQQIQAEKQRLIKEKKIKKDKPLPEITDDEKPFEIPDSWKWVRLLSVVEIATNLVCPDAYVNYKHIAPDNIEKGTGKLLEVRTVGEDKVSSSNHLFFKGQIIYSKIRPLLKKAVIAPYDGLCSADMYPLNVSIDTKFTLYYILSNCFNSQIADAMSSRVKMPKINQKELSTVLLPLPPLAEQKRIVAKLEELLPLCERLK